MLCSESTTVNILLQTLYYNFHMLFWYLHGYNCGGSGLNTLLRDGFHLHKQQQHTAANTVIIAVPQMTPKIRAPIAAEL